MYRFSVNRYRCNDMPHDQKRNVRLERDTGFYKSTGIVKNAQLDQNCQDGDNSPTIAGSVSSAGYFTKPGSDAPVMEPSEHEKSEWSRFARAAYAAGRNGIGHRFSMAATLRRGEAMALWRFDHLQAEYRAWLVFGEFADDGDQLSAQTLEVAATA